MTRPGTFSMGIGAILAARLKTTRRDASAERVLFALGRHRRWHPVLTRRDTSERLSTHGWQNAQLCTAAAAAGPHPKAEHIGGYTCACMTQANYGS